MKFYPYERGGGRGADNVFAMLKRAGYTKGFEVVFMQ